jgi:hypothetical protein
MTRSGLPAFDNSIVKPDPTLFSIDLSGTQVLVMTDITIPVISDLAIF